MMSWFIGCTLGARSSDRLSDSWKTCPDGMGVSGERRVHSMSCDLRQIRIVNRSGAKVRDVAMAALVGADVD